jgi:hypothetical protein
VSETGLGGVCWTEVGNDVLGTEKVAESLGGGGALLGDSPESEHPLSVFGTELAVELREEVGVPASSLLPLWSTGLSHPGAGLGEPLLRGEGTEEEGLPFALEFDRLLKGGREAVASTLDRLHLTGSAEVPVEVDSLGRGLDEGLLGRAKGSFLGLAEDCFGCSGELLVEGLDCLPDATENGMGRAVLLLPLTECRSFCLLTTLVAPVELLLLSLREAAETLDDVPLLVTEDVGAGTFVDVDDRVTRKDVGATVSDFGRERGSTVGLLECSSVDLHGVGGEFPDDLLLVGEDDAEEAVWAFLDAGAGGVEID